jgi:hypothetical protein
MANDSLSQSALVSGGAAEDCVTTVSESVVASSEQHETTEEVRHVEQVHVAGGGNSESSEAVESNRASVTDSYVGNSNNDNLGLSNGSVFGNSNAHEIIEELNGAVVVVNGSNNDQEDMYHRHTSGSNGSHSPNLSPVKKEFSLTNGGVEATNGGGNVVAGNVDELVQGGIVDDVMVRSFIEDPSDPLTNPFNSNNGEVSNGFSGLLPAQRDNLLNDSNELNRTHELPQDEEDEEEEEGELIDEQPISVNINVNGDHHAAAAAQNGSNVSEHHVANNGENGFDCLADKLINGFESLKLNNGSSNGNHVVANEIAAGESNGSCHAALNGSENRNGNGSEQPHKWNVLELPKPINPNDVSSKTAVASSQVKTSKLPSSPSTK